MTNLGDRIRTGSKWLLINNTAGYVIRFATGVVLARLLTPADFGLVATVGVFTGLAGFVSGAGMGQALVRAKEAEKRDFDVVFTCQVLIGIVIYLCFYVAAPWIAELFSRPLYIELVRISALSFLVRPFINLPMSKLHRNMEFGPVVSSNMIGLLVTGAVGIGLAWLSFGPWSLIFAGLAGATTIAFTLLLSSKYAPTFRLDRAVLARYGSYGLKVASNNFLQYLRDQTAVFVLSKFNGPSDVGLFRRASGLSETPMKVVGSAPYQAVFRALAEVQESRDQSKYIYYRTMTLVAVYTLPFYIGLWWLAEPGIMFIYGSKWVEAAAPLEIMAFLGIFSCIGNPSGAVIEARNRIGMEVILNIIVFVALVLGCLFALRWGLVGIAIAVVTTSAVFAVSVAYIAAKEVGGKLGDLVISLTPALVLNGVLVIVLAVVDDVWGEALRLSAPGAYLLMMTGTGFLVYGISFLTFPISSLKTETVRWKRLVGL